MLEGDFLGIVVADGAAMRDVLACSLSMRPIVIV
jgi:hypothetical protein